MVTVDVIHGSNQLLYSTDMFLNLIAVMFSVNVIDRSLQCLKICQVLVNFCKMVLPLNVKDWTNKTFQIGGLWLLSSIGMTSINLKDRPS